jgi:hypothetical protein
LTLDYNFKKQQGEDKIKSIFERLIQGCPNRKKYPNDRIDEIIFDAIRIKNPKSILRNDTILFKVDEEELSQLKNKKVVKSSIYFSPDFSDVLNVFDYIGMSFKAPKVSINIFTYYNSDILNGHFFFTNYSVTEENVVEKLSSVKFE